MQITTGSPIRLFALVALSAWLLAWPGCSGPGKQPEGSGPPAQGRPVAAPGDTVSVHYTGKLKDGTVFDSSLQEKPGRKIEPLSFTVGAGQMIPGFDQAVRGMAVGDKKTVELPPEQAYGQRDERKIYKFPKAQLGADVAARVKKGDQLQMSMASGRVLPVTVIEVADDAITVDANHELAGKTLTFEIQMVSIEKGRG